MERFNAETVSLVTGYSVASIKAWAARYKDGVKEGLTVLEVIEFLNAPKLNRQNGKPDEEAAKRLRVALEVMGAIPQQFELKG